MESSDTLQDIIGFAYRAPVSGDASLPFLLRPVRMGCEYCKPNFRVARQADYPYVTLHVLFSGCSFFRIGQEEYLLKKGDAFLISAGQAHAYHNTRQADLGYLWIELDCSGCMDLVEWFRAKSLHVFDTACTQRVTRQLAEILRHVKTHPDESPFVLSGMCYMLVMELYEAADRTVLRQPAPLVVGALYYINSHFKENPSVGEIAAYLNVSESCLTKQFRRFAGVPPAHYMQLKRLEYAAFLVKNTGLSCEEIASQAGFYDAAHLHKALSKHMGTSITALRASAPQET